VFKGVSPVVCSEVGNVVQQREFHLGELLPLNNLSEGSVAVIAVGTIRMDWGLEDGRRMVLGFRFKGDVLHRPCGASGIKAVSLTDGILYEVNREFFSRCRERNQGLIEWEHEVTQESLSQTISQTVLLGRLTASERITLFLLEMAARIGEKSRDGMTVALAMGRGDIADYLGLNSETVSRQFSKLKKAGLVLMPKPGVAVIPDLGKMALKAPRELLPGVNAAGAKPRRSVA